MKTRKPKIEIYLADLKQRGIGTACFFGFAFFCQVISNPPWRSGVSAERRILCLRTGSWRRSAETPLRGFGKSFADC
jgi:hypothetical protein